jgi:Rap1 Myb domain
MQLLQYIAHNDLYKKLGGNTIWQEMATRGILKRSWASLKERFKKVSFFST